MLARSASRTLLTSNPRRPSADATSTASLPGLGSVPMAAYAPLPTTSAVDGASHVPSANAARPSISTRYASLPPAHARARPSSCRHDGRAPASARRLRDPPRPPRKPRMPPSMKGASFHRPVSAPTVRAGSKAGVTRAGLWHHPRRRARPGNRTQGGGLGSDSCKWCPRSADAPSETTPGGSSRGHRSRRQHGGNAAIWRLADTYTPSRHLRL